MNLIYEPAGAAREYSPLALNIYVGCDHACGYCFVPQIMGKQKGYNHDTVKIRDNFLNKLRLDFKNYKYSKKLQVLLSIISDPYCKTNDRLKLTRKCLELFYENRIPVAILTKGGTRALQDLDIFKKFGEHIKVGATLTRLRDKDSLIEEPGAAVTTDRLEMLKVLHKNNIPTWASMEPVIVPRESIELMLRSILNVNHYKIGKMNHNPEFEKTIDWEMFLWDSLVLMQNYEKEFYIKDGLAKFGKSFLIPDYARDRDYLNVNPFPVLDETANVEKCLF